MSNFLSNYIIFITVINIVGCLALLYFTRKKKDASNEVKTTGHVYDGIEEYDNPMPRWWLWLFYITIVFSIIYLLLYPGLGKFQGFLGWSQVGQYNQEVQVADEKYLPLYRRYSDMSIVQLQDEPQALQMGQSIFANTCFGCHGADARGSLGFPNLTDSDWLYGGNPEQIKLSIAKGRNGNMPAWSEILSDQEINQVSSYISSQSQSDRAFVKELVDAGKAVYSKNCAACHGQTLEGNFALGAPNLVDNVWLHGSSPGLIKDVIRNGRINRMPGHTDIIGDDKVHLVAAYVYSLSQPKNNQQQ